MHRSLVGDPRAPQSLEQIWAILLHRVNLPWVQDALVTEAGVQLDRPSYLLLSWLAAEGTLHLNDLAERQGSDVTTVCRQIQHCERLGYVSRVPDDRDHRAIQVRLTDSGLNAVQRLRAVREAFFRRVLAAWSEADVAAFRTFCERFANDCLATLGERPCPTSR